MSKAASKKVYPIIEPEQVLRTELDPHMVYAYKADSYGTYSYISPIFQKTYSHLLRDSSGSEVIYCGQMWDSGQPIYLSDHPELSTEFELLALAMKKISVYLVKHAKPRDDGYGDNFRKLRERKKKCV